MFSGGKYKAEKQCQKVGQEVSRGEGGREHSLQCWVDTPEG